MELGAAPTEMIQSHRMQLNDIDEMIVSEWNRVEAQHAADVRVQRNMFDREETIKRTEIERRKKTAGDNCARIRNELENKAKNAEADWQAQTAKWLNIAKKKIQVKQNEDRNARAAKVNKR